VKSESKLNVGAFDVPKFSLNDLKMYRVLGVGGFGLVSLCQNKTTKDVYALKKMQKERIVEAQMQDMIVNEKKFLCEMNNPFVLGLVGTSQDIDSVYLILEFLQGGDLFGLLEKLDTLSVNESKFYMGCTVEALCYVHGKNLAFRDLKLENLVLDNKGYCKLVDFGLAKRGKMHKRSCLCIIYEILLTNIYFVFSCFLSPFYSNIKNIYCMWIT
jgi:serine/threonine protein kinase